MKFSAQEEYGLRCLVALGREGEGGFLTIPQIAEQEGLTVSHVAKLMAILRRANFVKATRGQSGGYALKQKPEEIIIGNVLAPLGGKIFDIGFCDRHTGHLAKCAHMTDCALRPVWTRVQAAVDSIVMNITLADMLASEVKMHGFDPKHERKLENLPQVR